MSEQDRRAQVKEWPRRRLHQMVAPPFLGLGLAPYGGCGAHTGSLREQRLPPQVNDAEPENLSFWGDDQGISNYNDPEFQPKPYRDSPATQRVFRKVSEIARALERCDLPFLRTAILSHAELASLRVRPATDGSTYETMVAQWLAEMTEGFCPHAEPGAPRICNLFVDDLVTVPAGEEWRHPLSVVHIPWQVLQGGTAPRAIRPLVLVLVRDGWRIMVQQP